MPEIMDGKNIADFIDPDIAEKLEALEREEDRLEAEGFYKSDDEEIVGGASSSARLGLSSGMETNPPYACAPARLGGGGVPRRGRPDPSQKGDDQEALPGPQQAQEPAGHPAQAPVADALPAVDDSPVRRTRPVADRGARPSACQGEGCRSRRWLQAEGCCDPWGEAGQEEHAREDGGRGRGDDGRGRGRGHGSRRRRRRAFGQEGRSCCWTGHPQPEEQSCGRWTHSGG